MLSDSAPAPRERQTQKTPPKRGLLLVAGGRFARHLRFGKLPRISPLAQRGADVFASVMERNGPSYFLHKLVWYHA